MSVRARYLVPALAATVVLGFGSHSSGSEPLEPASAVRFTASLDRTSAARSGIMSTALSVRERTNVASETRRLDLSKLTMADFGDVEAAR